MAASENRGQGATEYLVLLAVVLIIALVSISLLGFFPGMASDAQISQSKIYWSGEAAPMRIMDAAIVQISCSDARVPTGYRLVLQNAGADSLTFTGVSSGGDAYKFCLLGNASNIPFAIGAGEAATIDVAPPLNISCGKGSVEELQLTFSYSSNNALAREQVGAKKLALRCP